MNDPLEHSLSVNAFAILRLNLGESHSLMLYLNVEKRKDNETVMVSRTKCSKFYLIKPFTQ